ncbi:uncharacterized protein LDX57_011633 [Aspergillus melleus]|uniref:uncharacterized protein n=1 Tax=Aspergillus melleus TaxID=138277 RepID=UPI001E8CDBAA|nr:uncharacterized protein LDX57_011633 [Aspergillus melleus]KAH8433997.1 hypothetical protein LDX57_011633 [Aspergillus melleus]
MRFSLAALSTVLLMGAVYAAPAPGGSDDKDDGKTINIDHLQYITNKYTCVEENHTIDLGLLVEAGDGCAKSALLELGLLNIL